MVSSDLLYLLDIELNAKINNEFFFPEQFNQPVYHDKNCSLKSLVDEDGELNVKSTKYDKEGKATDKKEPGVWDYGFGSILQYQKYKENREMRATVSKTHEWDFDKKKLVEVKELNPDDSITEKVDGYPRDAYMITKVTFPIGTIEHDVDIESVKTSETFTKKVDVEVDGEMLERCSTKECRWRVSLLDKKP